MNEARQRRGGVLLTGATGLVGGYLLPRLAERFERVRTLSRGARAAEAGVEARAWDGVDPGRAATDEMDTVIHLAGEPIFGGLLTQTRMNRIRASRVDSTRRIVDRILEREPAVRPRTLICASAVGFYGDAGEVELPETAPSGEGFLAEVCRAWEKEAERAEEGGLRVVRVRIGVVLSRESGALALMRLPFSLGVGGRLGSGRQFFPWIHAPDLAEAILFCVDSDLSGPVNAVSPKLVRNAELTRALAAVLKRPALLPVPAWVLRAALGPISGELLGSRRVIPSALIEAGFQFRQPDLCGALAAELA